jgi:hypothetical protein
MMRFDLGISRTQFLVEYRKPPLHGPVNLSILALRVRNCIAEVYQDTRA